MTVTMLVDTSAAAPNSGLFLCVSVSEALAYILFTSRKQTKSRGGVTNLVLNGVLAAPLALVRFYPKPRGLEGIKGDLITYRLKSPSVLNSS
jgi:hypothetical protein